MICIPLQNCRVRVHVVEMEYQSIATTKIITLRPKFRLSKKTSTIEPHILRPALLRKTHINLKIEIVL